MKVVRVVTRHRSMGWQWNRKLIAITTMESQFIKLDESIFNDLNESRELLESQQGAIYYG